MVVKLAEKCEPLRRHSLSAPSLLAIRVLDDCLARTKALSNKVQELSHNCQRSTADIVGDKYLQVPVLYRSRSASAIESVQLVGDMARRCHQCHTPLEEGHHAGVRTGVGVCSLPHWSDCDGDIPEGEAAKGQVWAPCPEVVETTTEDSSGVISDSDKEAQSTTGASKFPESMEAAKELLEAAMQEVTNMPHTEALKNALSDLSLTVNGSSVKGASLGDASASSGEEELLLKRRQLEQLKLETVDNERKEAEKRERKKQRRLRRERELAEIEKQTLELKKSISPRPSPSVKKVPPKRTASNSGSNNKLQDQVANMSPEDSLELLRNLPRRGRKKTLLT